MTPFGARVRAMRAEKGVSLKQMADALGVSAAYLSALEHGHRGKPSWTFVQRVIAYFNIIWDDAEEMERLAQISDPRVIVRTAGLSPQATELANRLAEVVDRLDAEHIETLLRQLDEMTDKAGRPG
jgi:transcriptional regulator with XRE-family HTH domain